MKLVVKGSVLLITALTALGLSSCKQKVSKL